MYAIFSHVQYRACKYYCHSIYHRSVPIFYRLKKREEQKMITNISSQIKYALAHYQAHLTLHPSACIHAIYFSIDFSRFPSLFAANCVCMYVCVLILRWIILFNNQILFDWIIHKLKVREQKQDRETETNTTWGWKSVRCAHHAFRPVANSRRFMQKFDHLSCFLSESTETESVIVH